jgi:predicted transcriptional regulator of viral defense system
MGMVYTYQELIQIYGNERQIRKAVAAKKIFLISRGYYGDEPGISKDYIFKKYPGAILTGKSAFYFYGLTDSTPDFIEVASLLGTTRIKEKEAKQSFQIADYFPLGKTETEGIPVYDRERMLIELFRLKKRWPYDFYKEVLNAYREIRNKIDFYKVAAYLKKMNHGEKYLREINEAF